MSEAAQAKGYFWPYLLSPLKQIHLVKRPQHRQVVVLGQGRLGGVDDSAGAAGAVTEQVDHRHGRHPRRVGQADVVVLDQAVGPVGYATGATRVGLNRWHQMTDVAGVVGAASRPSLNYVPSSFG